MIKRRFLNKLFYISYKSPIISFAIIILTIIGFIGIGQFIIIDTYEVYYVSSVQETVNTIYLKVNTISLSSLQSLQEANEIYIYTDENEKIKIDIQKVDVADDSCILHITSLGKLKQIDLQNAKFDIITNKENLIEYLFDKY